MTGTTQKRTREQILADLIQDDIDQVDYDRSTPEHRERVIKSADWALGTYGAKRFGDVSECVLFG